MKEKDLEKQEFENLRTYLPKVDIIEGKNDVTILADMPGVDEKSVTVDLDHNLLTLKGSFMLEAPDGFEQSYAEYESGHYQREFTLGDEIDGEGIEALVRNGVLTLKLPKSKKSQPRKIAVKAG